MNEICKETMAEMNWTEIRRAADAGSWVLLPLGVIEEHGPHLPLATDTLIARILCLRVREKFARRGQAAIIAPPYSWGICQANAGFIGCFTARPESVSAALIDILTSLKSFGFTRVLGINAHNDVAHAVAILGAFCEARKTLGIDARFGFSEDRLQPFGLTGDEPHLFPVPPSNTSFGAAAVPDVHAGDIETAIIQTYYPELVDAARAKALPPVALPR